MRVLFVIHFPVFGGPHNQALRLAAPLRSRGWETVVLLPVEPGNAAGRLEASGVEVVTMPLHRLRASFDPRLHLTFLGRLAPEVRDIRRLIRERAIDLVQVGGLINPHAAFAARLEHVPVVWQLLDTRAPMPLAAVSMGFVRTLADVVMSTGRSVALSHPGGSRIADRIVAFFPPVDVDLFRPRPEERALVRSEWGISENAPVVGCVANLNPQKDIVGLIQAFALVRGRAPDARLLIVGAEYPTQAAYSTAVRNAVARAGLTVGRDVIFAGERSDVERQLAGMDVFAFAPLPRGEGISTVVLEAMSAALPVVSTDVAGLHEAIETGVNGFLVPPGDPGAMANAVVGLLSDRARSDEIGAAARRQAVTHFGIDTCVDDHIRAYERALFRGGARPRVRIPARPSFPVAFVCPSCRGAIEVAGDAMLCSRCRIAYPVVDQIPVLLQDVAASMHDESGHRHERTRLPDARKSDQADHFDRAVADDFEITRPHGTPRLYRFLLLEKFRRATTPLKPHLVGASALTVCGGSGMDAEFLARAGASVVSSDISLGAAQRTRERARRYGLDIRPVVADAEHLPFADAAFDLVFVHDGLHHLVQPMIALQEMGRVSRRWVSITEPTRALATSLAVRAGIALEREPAGNVVIRLPPAEVVSTLASAGYRPLVAQRYAMYYRHEPGPVLRALSSRWIFPLARLIWQVGNGLIGRAGNKMVVIAEKDHR